MKLLGFYINLTFQNLLKFISFFSKSLVLFPNVVSNIYIVNGLVSLLNAFEKNQNHLVLS